MLNDNALKCFISPFPFWMRHFYLTFFVKKYFTRLYTFRLLPPRREASLPRIPAVFPGLTDKIEAWGGGIYYVCMRLQLAFRK